MKLVEILARELDEWPDQPVPVPWVCKDGLIEVMFCHDHSIKEGKAPVAVMVYGCVFIGPVTREMWQSERAKQEGPDWSKAPEGATHWEPENVHAAEGWMQKCGDSNLWRYWRGTAWSSAHMCSDLRVSLMIPLPTQQWNGEGLPPVGTVCEAVIIGERMHCTVVAHFEGRAVVILPSKESAHIADLAQLRPILTQEQNNEREAALKEIMDTTGACRNIAEELYSAGYRKQELSK